MDENLKKKIQEQNKQKLEEQLKKVKASGGVPPKEEPKKEKSRFDSDWDAWRKMFGGKVIDFTDRAPAIKNNDFKLLGVPEGSSAEEIRKAFYKKAKKMHPDAGGDKNKFQELVLAYERVNGKQGEK